MNAHALVVLWLFQLMSTWSPPERRADSLLKDAQESKAQAIQRYLEIAQDAVEVAYMEEEPPILTTKDEEKARAWTALLLLSVSYFESGFRRDVDLGVGRFARGDGGRSWCLNQINIGKGKVPDANPVVGSWTGKDLVADRKKCFRTSLRMIRRSFSACSSQPFAYRLSAYAAGSCDKGHDESNARLKFFNQWLRRPPAEKTPLITNPDAARSSP